MFNNARKGLKAWVRYDGNNNAVAGSLIFQKDKPKVGKWREYVDVNLCCIPTPTPACDASKLNLEQLLVNLNGCYEEVTNLFPTITYFTDEGDPTNIWNGCNDMYDYANAFNTNLTQGYNVAKEDNVDFDLSIPYTHTQDNGSVDECDYTNPPMDGQIVSGVGYFNTAGTTCSKYFTNMYPGMFVLAATGVNVSQFGIYGNLGSDGNGLGVASSQLSGYPEWTVFLKTNYDNNENDPSVTHIILVYGNLDDAAQVINPTGDYDDDAIVGLGSQNSAIICLVIATQAGQPVLNIDDAVAIGNKVLDIYTTSC
jgi:hypothetical protein